MTFFQFKQFSFINCAIKRIVDKIKKNEKCFFVNLTNKTFWKDTPRGQEILEFFKGMTNRQTIEFFCLFDIFFVGYHNGMNAYVSMTANQSSQKFEKTLWVSILKGYKQFTERCSGQATPSIKGDLRGSIGDSQSPIQLFKGISSDPSFSSGFPSVDRACGLDTSPLLQGLSTRFGGGPANGLYSQFQEQGPCSFVGGPALGGGNASNFSFFSSQPHTLGGENASNFSFFSSQPPALGGGNATHQSLSDCLLVNPFTLNMDFVPFSDSDKQIRRQGQLKIVKGRVVQVEIPSDCSSGPSTSSTVEVGGIAKKSPMTQTPIATKIAKLEKKISKLESQNPRERSLDFLELQTLRAKLKKIQNSS